MPGNIMGYCDVTLWLMREMTEQWEWLLGIYGCGICVGEKGIYGCGMCVGEKASLEGRAVVDIVYVL